jgi:hypothetical protein
MTSCANLSTEKYYRENETLDLSVVLLHIERCIISEGTVDCAKDFLGLELGGEYGELVESLDNLRRMINLNVAYMLNVENAGEETAVEYIALEGFVPIEREKRNWVGNPFTPDGKPNLFKFYTYTYFFGKGDYVLPTFQRAQKTRSKNSFKHYT